MNPSGEDASLPRRRPGARAVVALFVTVAIGVAWFLVLRPTGLGGPAGYVMVAGHSMEPTLVTGDLAVTQRQSAYSVGDIVAYSTEAGVVIHRIIGGDAQRGYDVQGDNKAQPDLWHPRPGEVIGRVWFHVPMAGTAVAWLRQPANLAALSAALAFLVVFSWNGSPRLPARGRE